MKLTQLITENLTHLKWGSAAALALLAMLLVGIHLSGPLALAAGGALFGWALERYQAVRREGVPSKTDMLATAAPFVVIAAVWQLWLVMI